MKFGILNDLHLGQTGYGQWHNRQIFDHAEELAGAAVEAIARENVDLAVALGDLSHDGDPQVLERARDILSGLPDPWFAIPGNHDRSAEANGVFDEVFGDNAAPIYLRLDGVGMVFLRRVQRDEDYGIGDDAIERIVSTVGEDKPESLVIFSHIPVVSEKEYAESLGAKYAGHYPDGEQLLASLSAVTSVRPLLLSAHQHWHHIEETPTRVLCTTAAVVAYPMEIRIVSFEDSAVETHVVPIAGPELLSESLIESAWVGGTKDDRERRLQM